MKDPQLARSLEVRERHSGGAFADRYVAVDRSSGRRLLLSVPRLDPARVDRDTRERALQAIARYEPLIHPHICAQLGAGVASSGHLWIAQELPDDSEHGDGVGGADRPSPNRLAEALTHIAEALAYAHAQGLPHGAVTAEAVIGLEGRSPRLADFGVGAALYEAGLLGECAGESGVAAPEVVAGGGPSPGSDVYALGALGIIALSPEGEGARSPDGLGERARRIPGAGLAAALGRAVEPEPSARPRSAEEMLQQLRSVVTPPGAPRTARRKRPAPPEKPLEPTGPEMSHRQAAGAMVATVFRSTLNLLLALALLAAAVAGGLALAVRQTPHLTSVPGVEGKPAGVAVNMAKQRGLKAEVVREVYDADVAVGHVVRQTPYAGKTVREGRALDLVVSLGPPKVKVPKVTGKALKEAKALLISAGLAVGSVNREPASGEPDQVLQQSPAPDTEVPVNTLVSVTVAGAAKPDAEPKPGARAADISVTVPEGPVIQRVRIEVHHPNGRYTVAYDRVHQPGDKVEGVHIVAADEATVQVFIDGELVKEQALEPPP